MSQPFWKRILSYFFEQHIESVSSDHNPHLYVSLKQGRYQLSTANAVYSYGDLYDNFSRAFRRLDLDRIGGESILLLGFGLGSIPVILEKTFGKMYHYTAVEIDEAVLYLAGKYILPELKSGIEFICADALAFASRSEEKFDMICMDVFLDDIIPNEFEQTEFLENLARLLNPDGILLYNRLAVTPRDRELSSAFYEEVFQKTFPQATFLDLNSNWMLLNRTDLLVKP
jgi:SAM-dependent methyltransferase